MVDLDELRRLAYAADMERLDGRIIEEAADEIAALRDLVRMAGDVHEQLSPDVNWSGVPPWTMETVERFDRTLEKFDQDDDRRYDSPSPNLSR